MSTTELLVQPLDCTGTDRDSYTLPAGFEVTVRRAAAPRWLVVLDGRVYRADAVAVLASLGE